MQNTVGGGLFGQTQQQPQQTLGQSQFFQQPQQQQQQQPQQQLAPWQSGLEPQLQLDQALMVDVPGDMLFEDIEKKFPQLASWILNVESVPHCFHLSVSSVLMLFCPSVRRQAFARERKLREGIDTQGLGGKLLEDRQEIRRIESVRCVWRQASKRVIYP